MENKKKSKRVLLVHLEYETELNIPGKSDEERRRVKIGCGNRGKAIKKTRRLKDVTCDRCLTSRAYEQQYYGTTLAVIHRNISSLERRISWDVEEIKRTYEKALEQTHWESGEGPLACLYEPPEEHKAEVKVSYDLEEVTCYNCQRTFTGTLLGLNNGIARMQREIVDLRIKEASDAQEEEEQEEEVS